MASSVKTSQTEIQTQTTTSSQDEPDRRAGQDQRDEPGLRPSPSARRAGYLAVILISAGLLCVIDWYPGWHAAAFLTLAAASVISMVNLLLVALILVNLVYLAFDPPWIRLAGDLACAIIGLITAIRIWQVFPFAFGGSAQPWISVVRVLLVMAIAGTCAAIVVQIAKLIRIVGQRA